MRFNIHEEYWDRPLDGNDDTDHIPRGVAHVLGGFFRVVCVILWRFRVENQAVIDKFAGKAVGAVVVAPHTSFLDVVITFIAMRPKGWVRLMGRDTLFAVAHGFLGWVFSHVGAFPVKRDSADRIALKRAAHMLKNGEWVGIYPEGTRRGKGTGESTLHGGAALVARMGKAPLIPLGLSGVSDVKRKGERVRFPRITARFGEPIAVSSFDFLPKEERMDGATWYVMREAFALTRNCAAEDVDMVALFPTSKDYTAVFAAHPIEPLDPATLPDYQPKER